MPSSNKKKFRKAGCDHAPAPCLKRLVMWPMSSTHHPQQREDKVNVITIPAFPYGGEREELGKFTPTPIPRGMYEGDHVPDVILLLKWKAMWSLILGSMEYTHYMPYIASHIVQHMLICIKLTCGSASCCSRSWRSVNSGSLVTGTGPCHLNTMAWNPKSWMWPCPSPLLEKASDVANVIYTPSQEWEGKVNVITVPALHMPEKERGLDNKPPQRSQKGCVKVTMSQKIEGQCGHWKLEVWSTYTYALHCILVILYNTCWIVYNSLIVVLAVVVGIGGMSVVVT